MGSVDYLIVAAILIIVAAAGWYIRKAKKSGKKCIGCPAACSCNKGQCGCTRE